MKILGIINDFIEKNPDDAVNFLVKNKLVEEGHAINKPKPLFKEYTHEENEAYKERFKGKHS